jgi:methylaspartate mutase epsilon subunit
MALIDGVLNLGPDIGQALVQAFRRGYLDVPYCLHPDNAQRARAYIDGSGRLRWSSVGSMPLRKTAAVSAEAAMTSQHLLRSLSYVEQRFDRLGVVARPARRLTTD